MRRLAPLLLVACSSSTGPLQVGVGVEAYTTLGFLGVSLGVGPSRPAAEVEVVEVAGPCERRVSTSSPAVPRRPRADDPVREVERAAVSVDGDDVDLHGFRTCLDGRRSDCAPPRYEATLPTSALGAVLGLRVDHALFGIDEPELLVLPPGPLRLLGAAIGLPDTPSEVRWSVPEGGVDGEVTVWLARPAPDGATDDHPGSWRCVVPDLGVLELPGAVVDALRGADATVVVTRGVEVALDVADDVRLVAGARTSDDASVAVPSGPAR